MKRYPMLAVALIATAIPTVAAAQDTVRIAVVATSDVHGHAMHWDYARDTEAPWGLTRVATLVDSLRTMYSGNVVVLDAGDLIQGNAMAAVYSQPQANAINPMIDVLNSIGYDAMVLGNHEFNFGIPALDRILADASFTVLGANVVPTGGSRPAYRSAMTTRRGGVRIGIAGLTNPGSMVWDRAHLAGQLEIRPIIPVARATLESLANAGTDLNIVVVHSGMSGASSYSTPGVGAENVAGQLALLQPQPDLVIAGHSHEWFADSVVQGVHFMQPRFWAQGAAVAHITMVGSDGGYRVVAIRSELVDLAAIAPSPPITRRLETAHATVRHWVSSTIAAARGNWSAGLSRIEDTPVIDFVNEVQRRTAGTQLSTTSAFDTSVELGPGGVTFGDIAALYPYENTLRAVVIDGATLRAYLERSAAYFNVYREGAPFADPTIPGYDYDIVSGVDYVIDISRPPGSRVRQLLYQGSNVLPTDTFTLAVNSYRQAGGGRYDMFARLPVVYDSGESIRDLLTEAIRSIGTLNAADYFEESWRLVPADAAGEIRRSLAGMVRTGEVVLRILATGGLGGRIQPDSTSWSQGLPVGGLLATGQWFDSLTAECNCATLRLDGGNGLRGTPAANLSHGRVMVDGFNLMGIRAAAIGMQDLQLKLDTLELLSTRAGYTLLSANFVDSATGTPPPWTRSWIMAEDGGVRTAVIGVTRMMGPDPATIGRYRIEPAVDRLRQVLADAHRSSPAQTVVLTDATLTCDGASCGGDLIDLASAFDSTDITLILAPGDGNPVSTSVNGIRIVAPGSPGRIGVVDFVRAPDGTPGVTTRIQDILAIPGGNETLAGLIATQQAATDRVVGRGITTLRTSISRSDEPEYPLGRLVADALQNTARSDAALIPNSHIRGDLPAGPLVYGTLFDVLSEDQEIVVLELPGALLKEALEWALFDALPSAHVSGLVVRYDPERTPGLRIRDLRFPDGRRVRDNDTYTLAIPRSMHAGDEQYPMLFRLEARELDITELNALAAYLQRLPAPVQAPRTQRFTIDR